MKWCDRTEASAPLPPELRGARTKRKHEMVDQDTGEIAEVAA
jgi:hypothetical protein